MYKPIKIKSEVHKELMKIKVELIGKTENPNITYSDVLSFLIKFYREHQNSK